MTSTTKEDSSENSAPQAPLVHIVADESCLGNQFEDRANPGGAAGLLERFDERSGWYRRDFAHFDPDTTNNRMELVALIEAFRMVPEGRELTVYSDSDLCVKTVTQWAAGWEKRGWKRKGGPIKNLDLVQELFGLSRKRPELALEWVPGHSGWRWNEYADSLASAWRREEV